MNELLTEILNAREARAARQQALLQRFGCPVISFTMNIAGPVKTSSLIRRAFDTGLKALEEVLPEEAVCSRQVIHGITGEEALFAVDLEAKELKICCAAIEEATPMGRLFDMDVLDTRGRKLERQQERCCLVCGAPGRGCAAGRLHTVAQLQDATKALITAHFDGQDADRIGAAAVAALLEEVRTTPKPGLVDLNNNGSHRDMNVPLFTASAKTLEPYFRRCAAIGQETAELSPAQVFPFLRKAGLEAEKAMYEATGGVNTHKGAIYTLGILCAAFGRLWHTGETGSEEAAVLALCADIAGKAAEEDLKTQAAHTAGLKLYRELGITGIRGEMVQGLPSVKNVALPAFRDARNRGMSRNDAGAVTLLHLIARVQDTNLYHRGGQQGAEFAAALAQGLLAKNPYPAIREIEALDDGFIARNLSPGGCADLLAAVYFLDLLLSEK